MTTSESSIGEKAVNSPSDSFNVTISSLFPIQLRLFSVSSIVIFSTFIAAFYNMLFWRQVIARFQSYSLSVVLFCILMLLLIGLPIMLFLLVFGNKYTLKPLMGLLVTTACITAWFNHMGVVIGEDMVRNVFQTNVHEALELINVPFILFIIGFAALPTLLICKLDIQFYNPVREIVTRTTVTFIILIVIAILAATNFKFISYFGRENRDLRVYINPGYPLLSLLHYIENRYSGNAVFKVIGSDAHQTLMNSKKTVGILVVGETARADHFSLNGYSRFTNPNLSNEDILNFSNVTSCGTSTAYSVPCMFSFLNSNNYSPDKAEKQSNLLDVLESAGVKTFWRDNNSSCKGVCKRVEYENFRDDIDPESIYYHKGEYIDEVLLSNLEKKIDLPKTDMLIVFHQLGSHGLAYFRRYPEYFSKYKPVCESNSPQNCTDEAVINSYDNTILYTDYFLSKTIDILKQNENKYRSFLIYTSDHGESLGEEGIYLHGMPLAIAPEAQTHVPMTIWLSDDLKHDQSLASYKLENCLNKPVSHDNLVHSVLSLFHIETSIKNTNLDLFGNACNLI